MLGNFIIFGTVALVIVTLSVLFMTFYREGQCIEYGKEFGVDAHSVSLLHKRCAADFWPAHRLPTNEKP